MNELDLQISVAIPSYNCELQIGRVLNELDLILQNSNQIKDVYIIENNSTDNSLKNSIELIKQLKHKNQFYIYQNFSNIGLGGTHKVAFTLAKQKNRTHLLVIHGDHQASTFDIPKLIGKVMVQNGITTLGSRFENLSLLSGYSQTRKIGNIVLNFIYSLATRKKISDLGSGLNIFRLSDFDPEIYQKFDNGFTFNMDLLLYLIKKEILFQYSPIKWSTLDQISNARSLKVGIKTLSKLIAWLLSIEQFSPSHFETKLIVEPEK